MVKYNTRLNAKFYKEDFPTPGTTFDVPQPPSRQIKIWKLAKRCLARVVKLSLKYGYKIDRVMMKRQSPISPVILV